jgi:hypothetical protein
MAVSPLLLLLLLFIIIVVIVPSAVVVTITLPVTLKPASGVDLYLSC